MAIFDLLDRRLLALLDANARTPLAQLSKSLRQGSDRIAYRIARLQEAGILKGFSAVIDPFPLGLLGYKSYLKLENRPGMRRKLLQNLEKSQDVFWYCEGNETYDILFSIYARTPQAYFEIEQSLIAEVQAAVFQVEVFTVLSATLFCKKYLSKEVKSQKIIGTQSKRVTLDQVDSLILKQLSKNARISLTDLSKQVDLAPSNIANRITSLERSKVISGYRIEIDVSKINMMSIKAMLHLRSYQPSIVQKFFAFVGTHPFITYYIEQLGNAQIEIELDVTDYRHYAQIIEEIKQKFPTLISRIESVVINNEHYRWNFLPQDL